VTLWTPLTFVWNVSVRLSLPFGQDWLNSLSEVLEDMHIRDSTLGKWYHARIIDEYIQPFSL
jgi:hypothetical protein